MFLGSEESISAAIAVAAGSRFVANILPKRDGAPFGLFRP